MEDKYLMDGHKLHWHLKRVNHWMEGKKIAPIHIDVGLSKGCNIHCEYCFGAMQGNFYKKGSEIYFPWGPLKSYLNDAGEIGVKSMAFVGEAEPLMNPHVYDAIIEGKNSGIDIGLGTNGILFDITRSDALASLTWIRFNISAATEESYRRIHGSKDFNIAKDKIRFCVQTKKDKNLGLTIGLQMVLTPNNVAQAVGLAKLGKELGVDYLVIKQCSDSVNNDLGIFSQLGSYGTFTEILKNAEKESTDKYKVIVKWIKVQNKGVRNYSQCLGVPFLLYSSGDGRLYPCGAFFGMMEEEFRMGDLKTHTFKEIFFSKRYDDIIKKVQDMGVSKCYSNCRTHCINEYLWKLKHPPEHINFV